MVFDSRLDIDECVLEEIKKIDTPAFLTYHLVKQLPGIQSDNFIFETAIKNRYSEGYAVCKTSKIFILGTKGAFIIP